jgi:hypothetical protein
MANTLKASSESKQWIACGHSELLEDPKCPSPAIRVTGRHAGDFVSIPVTIRVACGLDDTGQGESVLG